MCVTHLEKVRHFFWNSSILVHYIHEISIRYGLQFTLSEAQRQYRGINGFVSKPLVYHRLTMGSSGQSLLQSISCYFCVVIYVAYLCYYCVLCIL